MKIKNFDFLETDDIDHYEEKGINRYIYEIKNFQETENLLKEKR